MSTLVDRYDLDGFYLSSLELPEAVNRLSSVDEHRVAALIHEPIPHIKVWEWKGESKLDLSRVETTSEAFELQPLAI